MTLTTFAGNSVVLRAADRYESGYISWHPEDPRGLGAGGHPVLPAAVPRRGAGRVRREPVPLPPAHAAAARAHRVRLGRRARVLAYYC